MTRKVFRPCSAKTLRHSLGALPEGRASAHVHKYVGASKLAIGLDGQGRKTFGHNRANGCRDRENGKQLAIFRRAKASNHSTLKLHELIKKGVNMEFKEVFKGIDSLYVSYRGTLKEGLLELLEEKKKLAQSDGEKERALATMDIEDHHFEVKDRGARYYSYILEDNWYHIQITASKKKMVPTLYIQIASELLNCLGHEYALYKLREIVSNLLIVIEAEKISRADIFVDFATNRDFEKIEKQSWITRAEDTVKRWKREKFTGWSIGRGGQISARLYEKTVEIKKSHKEYLHEIWSNQGWDKEQGVWRLEFQLRREFLGQMSVKMFSDLLSNVNDVWRYWKEAQDHLKRETRGKATEYLSTKINLKKKKYNKVLSKTMSENTTQ